MPSELIFTVQPGAAQPAQPISLAEAGLLERSDLQEWVRNNPEILGDDIRIVTFEFAAWQARDGRAADRLDLLGLDGEGRLLVAELKRGPAPDTVEMQAIKYAAFASRFTPETLADAHAVYLSRDSDEAVSPEDALARLVDHAGGELEASLLRQPRIALLASGFSPQVTATAVWLNEMGVSVRLIEFNAYQTEHDIVLAVSQTYPVPDTEDFTVSPRQAELRGAEERARTRRDASAVTRLVAEGVLDDGASLELEISALRLTPVQREQVAMWVAEDPSRGRATWRNEVRAPLIWGRRRPELEPDRAGEGDCGAGDRGTARGDQWPQGVEDRERHHPEGTGGLRSPLRRGPRLVRSPPVAGSAAARGMDHLRGSRGRHWL